MARNKEADEKFEAAINEYLASKGYGDGMLIDWMLVTAQHISHDDGESSTALSVHVEATQSVYRGVGLARYAVKKTEQQMEN